MAGLIEVSDLEKALNKVFAGGEIDQAQYIIDTISAFVETYTGTAFSLHTDEVVRQQADYYGNINLQPNPVLAVSAVTKVAFPLVPQAIRFYGFDQVNTLYGLEPHGVYDVTMDYGYETVPADIKGYVTEACKSQLQASDLSSFKIGDVTETYAAAGTDSPVANPMVVLGTDVLDSYKVTYETWRLGQQTFHPRQPMIPFN